MWKYKIIKMSILYSINSKYFFALSDIFFCSLQKNHVTLIEILILLR